MPRCALAICSLRLTSCAEIRKAVLPYNLNAFSQIAAEVAVENYENELLPLVKEIISERERLCDGLSFIEWSCSSGLESQLYGG